MALSPAAAQAFWHLARKADGAAQVVGLKRLALVSGVGRLYVHAADTKRPVELARYLKGLAPEDYRLVGTGPVRLVVAFPRPRLSVLARETEAERGQRWVKALTELPVRRAVLRLATGRTGTVQVAEVADPGAAPGFERFLSASVAGSGQSAKEVEQAQSWRREEVERVAGGAGSAPEQTVRQVKGVRPANKAYPTRTTLPEPRHGERTMAAPTTPVKKQGFGHEPEGLFPPGPMIAEDGSLA